MIPIQRGKEVVMRSIWSGAIGFGLVYIPVRMVNASEDQELEFNLLRRGDLCRIRYTRVCEENGEEVPYEEIVRGYEYEKGKWVVLEEEDFRRANVRKNQTIEIGGFIDAAEVDFKYLEKPFYLEPEKGAEAVYVLLREALKRSGKVGLARFVLRTREHMGILKAEKEVLILNQMRFASEIHPPTGLDLPGETEVSRAELDLAVRLIEALAERWNPEQYRDTYTEDLKRMIRAKIEGQETEAWQEEVPSAEVTDLYVQLNKSLQVAREKRSSVR
jgi:DNA end-binding protein Ku